jgi:hypothetical protein
VYEQKRGQTFCICKTKRLEGKISCTEFFKRVTLSGTVADCCELVISVLTSVIFTTVIIASAINEIPREEKKFVSPIPVCFALFALSAFSWSFRHSSFSSVCSFSFQFALSAFSLPFQLSVCSFRSQYILLAYSLPFQLFVCPFRFQFAISDFRLLICNSRLVFHFL